MAPKVTVESIVIPGEFNSNEVSYGSPVATANGGKMISVFYAKKTPLVFQTPEMYVPFGVNRWSDVGSSGKTTLDLSFKGEEKKGILSKFLSDLRSLDNRFVMDAFENSHSWLKRRVQNIDIVEALYTPIVKSSKDNKYPPTFRINLPTKDGKYAVHVFDASLQPLDIDPSDSMKGARVKAIVKCIGIWVAGSKFGSSWRAVQLIYSPSHTKELMIGSECAFRDDEIIVTQDVKEENGDAKP